MSEEWLERQEGPDGQWCDLLNRVPYDRQRIIEIELSKARSVRDMDDAALRGMLWACSVKNTLTGEQSEDISVASAAVVEPWRKRAQELYNDWYKTAFPGPKGSSRTGSRTQPSGKAK